MIKSISGPSGELESTCNASSGYAEGDEDLRVKCRSWQDQAAKILYNEKAEEDGTFLTFNLYAVHHERAKTLLRFALFYANDNELIGQLKNECTGAKKDLIKDAKSAIATARKHLEPGSTTGEMYLSITEAKIYLVAKEIEESASTAKNALQFAYKSHSRQGEEEIKRLHSILYQLSPKNPYVANLGVELKIFPN